VNAVADNRRGLTVLGATHHQLRPLGDDLAPPRPLYFTHLPLILAFTGVVAWVTGAEFSTALGGFVGGAVGCYMLWDWLIRGGDTRFTTVIATGLLIGYGLGAFNTWATTSRGGLSLGEFTGNDDAILARGMAAVLISCAICIFMGELFERPLFGRDFRIRLEPRLYTLIYLGTIMIAGAFATGSLTVSGANVDNSAGGIGVIKSFIMWIFPPLVTLSVAIFLVTPRGDAKKILSGVSALMLLIFVIVMGRRFLIYTVIETIFLARLTGVKLKGAISKKIMIFALVGTFVFFGALGFMLLRIAGYAGPKSQRSLGERLVLVGQWVSEGSAFEKAFTSTQTNVKTRTFVLGFFANVLEGSSLHTPGLGEDTIGLIQLSIPSIIYPEKDKFFNEETLTDRLFGFSYGDQANSLLTAGATDFGLLGVIAYPLIVAWILRTTIEFVSWRLNQGSTLLIILAVIFLSIQTEDSLTGYVNSLFYGLIFSLGFVVFFSLPHIRLKS
jgi:hypothetical protein